MGMTDNAIDMSLAAIDAEEAAQEAAHIKAEEELDSMLKTADKRFLEVLGKALSESAEVRSKLAIAILTEYTLAGVHDAMLEVIYEQVEL